MLDDLLHVIETLQQRIRDHGTTLRSNELRTRMALIDPLLTALGWDTADPELVTPEYSVGEGRADYALVGSEAIPAAVVEAKRLGVTLSDDERMQMLNYANARGVRYAAVTDGDVWEFYEVFKQAPLEDRRLLNLRIANRPAHELALQLLLLWRPNLASGQPVAARDPIASAASYAEVATPVGSESPTTSEIAAAPEQDNRDGQSVWVSLASFSPTSGGAPPARIRFADGSEHEVKYWFELVSHASKWLWTNGVLKHDNVPVQSGTRSKISIVSTEPVHHNGDEFRNRKDVDGTPLVVEGHGSGRDMRERTKRLLHHCGINPADVLLRVG